MPPQPSDRSSIALLVGLAMVGLVMGYMTGGSATPVVGAVIPAVGALGTLGLEFLKSRAAETRRDQLKDALAATPNERDQATLASALAAAQPARTSGRDIGFALIAMSAGFFIGSLGGTYARTHDVFAPRHAAQAPLPWENKKEWEAKNCNLTSDAMMRFVLLRRDLAAMGYSAAQTATFLEDPSSWCSAAPAAYVAPWQGTKFSSLAPEGSPPLEKTAEGMKPSGRCVVNANGAAQFAALRDYLSVLGFDPGAARRVFEESPGQWCPTEIGGLPELVRTMRQEPRMSGVTQRVLAEIPPHSSPYAK
jgi:hypothetical protein